MRESTTSPNATSENHSGSDSEENSSEKRGRYVVTIPGNNSFKRWLFTRIFESRDSDFTDRVISWKVIEEKKRPLGFILTWNVWGRRNDQILNRKETPHVV